MMNSIFSKFLCLFFTIFFFKANDLSAQDSTRFQNILLKASGAYGTFFINPSLVIKHKEKWKYVAGISYYKHYLPISSHNFNSSSFSFGLTGNLYRISKIKRFSLEYGPQIEIVNSNTKFIVDSIQSRNFNRSYLVVLLDLLLKYNLSNNAGIFLGYSYGPSYRLNELQYKYKNGTYYEGRAIYFDARIYIGCSFKF